MAVNLSKGANVNLSKEAPGLAKSVIGLGWNPRATDGAAFDLDASVFAIGEDGLCRSQEDFVFYNNKKHSSGAIEHLGDNSTGEGEGDDEQLKVNLSAVPAAIAKLVFAVTINDAEQRRQSFGQVEKAYIRILNETGGAELARYDLSEDASTETAMIFGELYRAGTDWKFKAIGQGYAGGLRLRQPIDPGERRLGRGEVLAQRAKTLTPVEQGADLGSALRKPPLRHQEAGVAGALPVPPVHDACPSVRGTFSAQLAT